MSTPISFCAQIGCGIRVQYAHNKLCVYIPLDPLSSVGLQRPNLLELERVIFEFGLGSMLKSG